ncbi:response regulator transcription factor [Streptomyces solicathayae]|uniref:Response regulator transcription factor n=1 Tax=Streptomyces solicathayae TaxID=3081768 RepID=A0ABZ0LSM2_9ACTN|nr:response regulator transcription factor [Streptomyces sp. HUAS YS2]WOX22357.1 response regulator transcription factor [Streptomyces sp. HUAS YS2]
MPDDVSHSSGQHWTQQHHVSQHTSSHPSPLSSHHTAGTPVSGSPVPASPVPASGGFPALPDHPPSAAPPLRVVVADDNPVVRAGLTVLLSGRDDIEVVAEGADGRQAYEAAVQHRPDVVLLDVRMPGVDGISALPHLVRIAPVLMMTYSRESEIVHEALRLGAGGYLVHGEFTADQLVAAVRDIKQGRAHFTHSASSALLEQLRGGVPGQGGQALPEGLGTAFTGPGYQPTVPQQPSAPAYETSGHHRPMPPMNPQVNAVAPVTAAQHSPQNPSLLQANMGQSSTSPQNAGALLSELSQREVEVMDLIASGMTNQQIAATCFISQKTVKNHINRIFAKLNAGSRGEAIAIWHGIARGGASRNA